jgi:hypothetical protein
MHNILTWKEHKLKQEKQIWKEYLRLNLDKIKVQEIVFLVGIYISVEHQLHRNQRQAIM